MAERWLGAPVAAQLTESLRPRVQALSARGVTPTLFTLRAGDRPDDATYETGLLRRAEAVGIAVRRVLVPRDCPRDRLLDLIRGLNDDPVCHGFLLFRPLPDPEDEEAARCLLDPRKDVDGMTPGSLAAVFSGRGHGYPPCTAQACLELLRHYGVDLAGKEAVVVGRSLVIGRPVSMLLQRENATVTMCHTRTADLPAVCRRAQVLVVAAGKEGLIGREHLSPGQVVLDVGIHVSADGALRGDVDREAAEAVAAAFTPVPGGIGAVTTAVLCKHVVEAAERSCL